MPISSAVSRGGQPDLLAWGTFGCRDVEARRSTSTFGWGRYADHAMLSTITGCRSH